MPAPACRTQPITTSPTSGGATRARDSDSRITTVARSTDDRSLRAPPNAPIGVRQALSITVSKSWLAKALHLPGHDQIRSGRRLHLVDCCIRRDFAKPQPLSHTVDECTIRD